MTFIVSETAIEEKHAIITEPTKDLADAKSSY